MNYNERARRIVDRIDELAAITEIPGTITRTYGTTAFMQGVQLVENWMKNAGLQTRTDNIKNVRGKLISKTPNAQTLIIASHIDTVIDAGKYDGPLGVVMGLDIVEHIITNKIECPFHIELIAFADEEGARFHTTYLGSKVVAGKFDETLLHKSDKEGIDLQEVICSIGGNPNALQMDKINDSLLGYFEIHIEQGPVLFENNIPVAVVTAIAGQKRIELVFNGVAGHAGTVPMDMRNDALCCAADCIINIEQFAITHKSEIVATVGKLNIENAASNVIPGKVTCTLDVRSSDAVRLEYATNALQNILTEICEDRNIHFQWNMIQQGEPVCCNEKLTKTLTSAIQACDFSLVELVSGAGHDAVTMSEICGVSMMFVRCYKGISHNPLEDVDIEDIASAIKVADHFITKLNQ